MFNVGDLVTGNENNVYGITNRNALCIVGNTVGTFGDDIIVFVLEAKGRDMCNTREIESLDDFNFTNGASGVGYFPVSSSYFRTITLEEWEVFKADHPHYDFRKNVNYDKLINYFTKGGETTMTTTTVTVAEPVINLTGTYNFTKEQEEYVLPKMKKLYDKFHHTNTEKGIKIQWEKYKEAKAPIASILSNHPNWDEKIMSIVLENSYSRTRDPETVRDFCFWCKDQLRKWTIKPENEYKINCCTVDEIYDSRNRLSRIVNRMEDLRTVNKSWGEHPHHVTFNGMTFEQVQKEHERLCELYRIADTQGYYMGSLNGRDFYATEEVYKKYNRGCMFLDMVCNYESHVADEEFAEKANEYAKPFDFEKNGKIIGLKAVKGQKISRIIGKFMKYYELDKIVDERREVWRSDNGELHTRTRDYGWNKKFAEFADAVNPLEIKRWTIISINPIDYLTMSFGNSWSSCQTIDKLNERHVDSEHNYSGMYCSGTLSYMLDGATVIMYTVDEKYKGRDFCLEDKMNRCNFHIGEDKFIQGRLYPEGRNVNAETSMASQFRAIFQKVLAECVNEPNLWKVFKGTGNCNTYARSAHGATNYQDWIHYDDCTVSLLKRNGYKENKELVVIGHKPICPCCGKEHSIDDSLACRNCMGKTNYNNDDNYVNCYACGDSINLDEDDYVYDEDRDVYFCDSDCASNYDCYWCDNVSEYHSEWVFEDNLTEEYFYDYCECHCVHINDEYHYLTTENAEEDGWALIGGEWYRDDDDNVTVCPHCGGLTLADHDECLQCGALINDEDLIDEAM